MDTLVKILALICLVEMIFITREFFLFGNKKAKHKPSQDTKNPSLSEAERELQALSTEVTSLQSQLHEAKVELEGMTVLWSNAVANEKALRKDLQIAQNQLTYLATKVVRAEKTQVLEKATKTSPQYWDRSPALEKSLHSEFV